MTDELTSVEVYQLRICLREISPKIWRRLLVRSDSTIADLHHTIVNIQNKKRVVVNWRP